jgi:hypothetical protein
MGEEIIAERISESVASEQRFLPSVFAADDDHKTMVLSVEAFLKTLNQTADAVRPLLIFDQFEEWITLFEDGSTTQSAQAVKASQYKIRDAIVSLINDRELPVKVLIVLREDYLARLAPLFERCPSLPDHYLRLTSLRGDQVYQAIRGPFEKYPDKYLPELSTALAKKIQNQFEVRSAGSDIRLTEVQIVCRSLFESGVPEPELEGRFADQGVQGILEAYLERALESLEPDQQDAAVALLARMVTPAGTRNVISGDDLLSRVEHEEDISRELLSQTLDSLEREAKLVRRERRREVYYYEIASEFLVTWIRIKGRQRQRLAAADAAAKRERQTALQRRNKLLVRAGIVGLVLAIAALILAVIAVRNATMAVRSAVVAQANAYVAATSEAEALQNAAIAATSGAEAIQQRDLLNTAVANLEALVPTETSTVPATDTPVATPGDQLSPAPEILTPTPSPSSIPALNLDATATIEAVQTQLYHIQAALTPTSTPTSIPTPELGVAIEDFEGYDDASITNDFRINETAKAEGSEGEVRVSEEHVSQGRKAMKFEFDIRSPNPETNYMGFDRDVPPDTQDWSNFSKVCLWIEFDLKSSPERIHFQFGEGVNEVSKEPFSLSRDKEIQCFDVQGATTAEGDLIDLSKIRHYGVYVAGLGSRGSLYIDDIRGTK